MYVGTLPPVSNRASWILLQEVTDDETGDLVDLSALTITLEVRDPQTCSVVLSATTTNGKITILDTGTFQAKFTETEMSVLEPQSYDVGATLADSDDTAQFFIGRMSVLSGVVSQ